MSSISFFVNHLTWHFLFPSFVFLLLFLNIRLARLQTSRSLVHGTWPAGQECIGTSRILECLVGDDIETTPIFVYSQLSVKLAENDISGNCPKHFDIRYHLVQDFFVENWFTPSFGAPSGMVSNDVTKALDKNHFTEFRPKMGIVLFPQSSEGECWNFVSICCSSSVSDIFGSLQNRGPLWKNGKVQKGQITFSHCLFTVLIFRYFKRSCPDEKIGYNTSTFIWTLLPVCT